MEQGFLYVAIGRRYLMEAEISARSLKRFTKYPVCLITDDPRFASDFFDEIILTDSIADFESKIIGIQKTPYKKTIYLDTDTFICKPIDDLFDLLQVFDMGMTIEKSNHSYAFFQRYNPSFKLMLENVLPEYNTGLIVYNSNQQVKTLLCDWLNTHKEMNVKADMPSFREAFIKNAASVRIAPLPSEYNYFGTHSFGFAHNEIKVTHERLGERWNSLTTVMLPFEKMDRQARKMNRYHCKRIIVPYIGVIPYTFSPYRIKYKIKQWLGIKKTKKTETF
jgi:alpha-N-acetylglucosamine transferase